MERGVVSYRVFAKLCRKLLRILCVPVRGLLFMIWTLGELSIRLADWIGAHTREIDYDALPNEEDKCP